MDVAGRRFRTHEASHMSVFPQGVGERIAGRAEDRSMLILQYVVALVAGVSAILMSMAS